jgi:hypothetical protein
MCPVHTHVHKNPSLVQARSPVHLITFRVVSDAEFVSPVHNPHSGQPLFICPQLIFSV